MKINSILLLKIVIGLIGIATIAFYGLALPSGIRSEINGDFDYGIIFVGLYIVAIPFLVALYQGFKLLELIDKNQAFSDLSARSLKTIKICTLIISSLFVIAMPYIFYLGETDDAPGVVAIGFLMIGTFAFITAWVDVMERLIRQVKIKS